MRRRNEEFHGVQTDNERTHIAAAADGWSCLGWVDARNVEPSCWIHCLHQPINICLTPHSTTTAFARWNQKPQSFISPIFSQNGPSQRVYILRAKKKIAPTSFHWYTHVSHARLQFISNSCFYTHTVWQLHRCSFSTSLVSQQKLNHGKTKRAWANFLFVKKE